MSEFLIRNAWLIPFFPLLGALIAAAGGRWLKAAGALSRWSLGIGLAFLVSLGLLTVDGARDDDGRLRLARRSAGCTSRSSSGSTA